MRPVSVFGIGSAVFLRHENSYQGYKNFGKGNINKSIVRKMFYIFVAKKVISIELLTTKTKQYGRKMVNY